MTRLAIDYEHVAKTWWEAGGRDLWEGILEQAGDASVVLDDHLARSWLEQAARIPGWGDGPEFAPHPIRAQTVEADDDLA